MKLNKAILKHYCEDNQTWFTLSIIKSFWILSLHDFRIGIGCQKHE